jgi:AAA domain
MTGFDPRATARTTVEQGKPQGNGNVDPFPVDTIKTLMASVSRITLVKGFAGRGELVLFYGPPKHGKTFLASHFSISVAVRANWFGRKHKAPLGFVLYCALEGGQGMCQRLKAILQHDPALGDHITEQNLIIMRQRIDLRQPTDVARLIATIAKHERETGLPCLLVVIDTVARALGSGNDTDPKDVSALIAADTIRQAGSQPTVALIHHAGKDVNRGPRGRSDLPGAIDTCVLVERLENGHGNRATCEYAKDDPDGWAIDFRLEQVEIGKDEDGDPITTCVLREGEAHTYAPPKAKTTNAKPYRGERQRIFVSQLNKLAAKHPSGVERSLLRSHFLCELNAERQRDGQEPLNAKIGASTFRQVLLHLRDRNPPPFTEDGDLIHPTEERRA